MKKSLIHKRPAAGLILFASLLLSLQACDNDKVSQGTEADKTATSNTSNAELVNTYWRLIELGGTTVVTREDQREMKFTLRGENKVNGFGGCNSFFGSYVLDENTIKFSQLAATRKFCAETSDKESEFMKSLSDAASYKITGQVLYLYNDDGETLQQLQAVYLK